MDFTAEVFLFIFAAMMAAVVIELWSIAKVLKAIHETLDRYEKKMGEPKI